MSEYSQRPPLQTPVLLIIFSRPETTEQVLAAIRAVRPARLYIAADGPRPGRPQEAARCAEARHTALQVDWPCEVKTLFRDENRGCAHGPAEAISWFFEQEERGIVLEDDILPAEDFFWFCEELLEKYRDDEQVMEIAAMNYTPDRPTRDGASYYFSRMGSTWGWASWSRAWRHFHIHVPDFQEMRAAGKPDQLFFSRPETAYVLDKLEQAYQKDPAVSWWDYQWLYTRDVHNALSIVPAKNLAVNIGFGEGATHTGTEDEKLRHMTLQQLRFPLVHPATKDPDLEADRAFYEMYHGDSAWEKVKRVIRKFVPPALLKQP